MKRSGLILACLGVLLCFPAVQAKRPQLIPWLKWAEEASKEDLRAMIRYLEDERAGVIGLRIFSNHHDRDVRGFAVLAMGRILDQADEAVTRRLKDSDVHVRKTAAFALGQIGDESAEAALLARLTVEGVPEVRLEIWRALGRVGGKATLDIIPTDDGAPDRADAVETGGLILSRQRAKTDEAAFILQALKASDPKVLAAAFYGLSRSRKPVGDAYKAQAVEALATIHDANVRRNTIKLLAKGAGKAAPHLARLLRTMPLSGHARAALSAGLSKTKGDDITLKMVGLLRHELRLLRKSGAWRKEAMLPALELAHWLVYRKANKEARIALKAMGNWTPADAEDPVDSRRLSRLHCSLSAATGNPDPNHCSDSWMVIYGEVTGKDLAFFKTAFAHKNSKVRMDALGAILARFPKEFPAALKTGLKDSDLPVVATAVELAMAEKVDLKAHEEALLNAWARAWKEQDIEALLTLLKALGTLKSPGATKALRQAGDGHQLALKRAAIKALGGLKAPFSFRYKRIEKVPSAAAIKPYGSQELGGWRSATIKTDIGSFTIEFLRAFAPSTVKKIGALMKKGFYKGLGFHRVVSNFVIQGGDPRGDGWGGPGYTMRCENNPSPYKTGTVGMALAGKDTGGSQFFVALDDQPHLLGTYTVFGRVSQGMEVVRAIQPGDKIHAIKLRK
jgi:cyclophilin family peptidyl-prolyl cis-trans isomerase/HEAT repeat protein